MNEVQLKTIMLIVIIFMCGLVGGIGNTLRENNSKQKPYLKNIVLGIIAAITVPLFLQLVSSEIIKNIINNKTDYLNDYFVFAGFCIIASFSSISFLNSVSGRVLQSMKQEIENLKTDHERIDKNLNAIAISDENQILNTTDMDKINNPEYIEIMKSIQNDSKFFRPLNAIKDEVNQDNNEIQKKIDILKEKKLIKELTLHDGSKAVALSGCAQQIINENKTQL
jgi:uncharacterized membrane protein YeaQ/YmgE (transglycosylase-associated protein family)